MPITEKQREALQQKLGRGKHRKVNREECVKLYLDGQTVPELAVHFGVQTQCIYYNLKAASRGK